MKIVCGGNCISGIQFVEVLVAQIRDIVCGGACISGIQLAEVLVTQEHSLWRCL